MEIKKIINSKISFFIILMVTANFWVSCGASKISFDVLQPPEMELAGPVSKIAILNRTSNKYGKTSQYVNGHIIAQFNNMTPIMVNESMAEFTHVFNDNGFAVATDTVVRNFPKTGYFRSAPLPISTANRTCKVLNVDALVTIEGYSAEIDTDSEVLYSTPVDRTYGTVRIPYFTGAQSVYMVMLYRTYMCNNGAAKIDVETELGTQVSNSVSGGSFQEVQGGMADAQNVMIQAARQLGTEFAENIGPKWNTVYRKIYTTGNPQMKEAYESVKKGDWPAATDTWYLLATSNDEKIAKRASFNLISASEVSGDLSLAIEWANICVSKYELKDATTYLNILSNRKEQIEKIHLLFPNMKLEE